MFSLIGLPFLCLLIAAAIIVPVLAVWSWDRPKLRFARRISLLVLSQALIVLVALVWINRTQDFYVSWTELTGHENAPIVTAAHGGGGQTEFATLDRALSRGTAGSWDRFLTREWRKQGSKGSLLLSFPLTGPTTHYTLPAAIYVPAAYFAPANRHRRFPVMELFPGYPGSPNTWIYNLEVRHYLDAAIASGSLPPTIGVLVFNDPTIRDSECVNAVGGPKAATYLGKDVPTVISHLMRTLPGRASWAAVGYSTGGYCALHIALTYPQQFEWAVSLSGYLQPVVDAATGDLYDGSRHAEKEDSVLWALHNKPLPPYGWLLGSGSADRPSMQQIHELLANLTANIAATTAIIPDGGHNGNVWKALEPAVWSWLGHRLYTGNGRPVHVRTVLRADGLGGGLGGALLHPRGEGPLLTTTRSGGRPVRALLQ